MDTVYNKTERVSAPEKKGWCIPNFEVISKNAVKGATGHQGNEVSGAAGGTHTYTGGTS